LGFTDALVLGLIAGVLEATPYLGPIFSALPALLFALSKGGYTPVWVLLAYLGVQLIENNIIAPLIIARSMKLHSVAVILFNAPVCRRFRCVRRSGRGTTGCHFGDLARRALSTAIPSHGNGRGPGPPGSKGTARKTVRYVKGSRRPCNACPRTIPLGSRANAYLTRSGTRTLTLKE